MAEKNPSAAKAEANEVEEVTFTVNVRGEKIKLTVPTDLGDAPFEAMEAIEDNKFMRGFMLMLGTVQANKLRSAGLTGRIFNEEVIPAWQEATGMGEG